MTSEHTAQPRSGRIDGLLNHLSKKSSEYRARQGSQWPDSPTPESGPASGLVNQPTAGRDPNEFSPPVPGIASSRFTPSAKLRTDWLDVVAPMVFEIGSRRCEVETASGAGRRPGANGWTLVEGTLNGEPFTVFAGSGFFETLLLSWDGELRALPHHPADAALALEVVLEKIIRAIENRCSQTIDIVSAVTVASLPDLPWLSVVIRSGTEMASAGISAGPNAGRILEAFTAQNIHPGERAFEKTLLVKIGPIAMSTHQVHRSRPGITVDCGADPSAEVRGILERSDGSFWPVSIEDAAVRISGPLQKPLSANPGKGTTLVTLCIGTVALPHFQRLLLGPDARLPVRRIPGNVAEFHVGRKALMHGGLDVVNGSLVLNISGDGAAQ